MQNFGRENFDDLTCIRLISSDFSTVKVLRYTVLSNFNYKDLKMKAYNILDSIYFYVYALDKIAMCYNIHINPKFLCQSSNNYNGNFTQDS